MSDDDEATESATPAAVPSVEFAAVSTLLSVIANERACRLRLRELRLATDAATEAKVALEAARVEHDATMARERAELEKLRDALRDREVKLHGDEGMLNHREKILAERKANLDAREGRYQMVGPGGLVQEFTPGYSRGEDEDVETRPVHHDDHFAAGSTLTREPETVVRSRGRPRRSVEL
jgi:hypothetical protein